jgi:hypothetical protein
MPGFHKASQLGKLVAECYKYRTALEAIDAMLKHHDDYTPLRLLLEIQKIVMKATEEQASKGPLA